MTGSLLIRKQEHKQFTGGGRPSKRHLTEYGGFCCMRCGVPEQLDTWPPFKGLPPCTTLTPLGWLVVVLLRIFLKP